MSIYTRWKRIWVKRTEDYLYRRAHRRQLQADLKKAKADEKDAKESADRAKRVVHRHTPVTGPQKAIRYARAMIGVKEIGGNNKGPQVEAWQRLVETKPGEMVGASWCGAFVFACLKSAGVKDLSWRMRYVPYIAEDAKLGKNGLKQLVSWNDRKPGDLILFQWDSGPLDHVGLYVRDNPDGSISTIEGNTSSGEQGSQSNGDGVYARARTRANVGLLVRPKYS